MSEDRKIRLPVWLLILDAIGTLFIVLGIYAQFGGTAPFFPDSPEIRQYSVALILAGILLILPLVLMLIKRSKSPQ